jgi:hypothetical protein
MVMGSDDNRPNRASNWTLATGTQPGDRHIAPVAQRADPQPELFEVSR